MGDTMEWFRGLFRSSSASHEEINPITLQPLPSDSIFDKAPALPEGYAYHSRVVGKGTPYSKIEISVVGPRGEVVATSSSYLDIFKERAPQIALSSVVSQIRILRQIGEI